jgi:hypothetical protein
MDPAGWGVALSLTLLTVALAVLSARGVARFLRSRVLMELMWGIGLSMAAVATAVELVVYLGVVDTALLQIYVFLSAAIVGMLSLGSTRVIHSTRFRSGYAAYTLAMCGTVAGFSFATPLSSSMVSAGVITGNPPMTLLVLSTLVTVPATVVLLGAVVLSLRKSWQWRTVLMGVGASVLAAGGAFYIASFPVVLYYAEFIGIVLIFLGLVSLPHGTPSSTSTNYRVPRSVE